MVCTAAVFCVSAQTAQRVLAEQTIHGVQSVHEPALPVWAVKTNLLSDVMTTLNLSAEFGVGKRTTLDIYGSLNPWQFPSNRKMRHWLLQPGLRWWSCSRFSGGFWGVHVHYGRYNWGGMMPWGFRSGKMFGTVWNRSMLDNRYQGWLAGAGISYGWHWVLGGRWGFEGEIGLGYAYLQYDKFRCERCGRRLGSGSKSYFGPTKASLSLVLMIR